MHTLGRFFFSLLFFALFACNGPTEPGAKNPREYTWTATQLTFSGGSPSSIYSIWGVSSSNVYTCGFSFLGGQKGAVYHYNGKQWANVATLPSPDYNDFSEIIGFGENDIWLVGAKFYLNPLDQTTLDSSLVLHYDGTVWKSMLPTHIGVRALRAAWGTSSQNLYFGSRDGKIIHYNGISWSVDTLHLGLSIEALGGDNENVFANGATSDTVMSFKLSNGTWQLLDQQPEGNHQVNPRFGLYAIYSISPGLHYSSSYGIFRWEDNEWKRVLGGVILLTGINGSGSNNIFAVGRNTEGPAVYHWDGVSWEEIILPLGIIPEDVLLYGIWTDSKEAFIVGNGGGKSYVLHGKQQANWKEVISMRVQ